MRRLYLIILACWAMLSVASAQELTVKEMKATNDISASQYERKDLNGQACALVKVLLASPGALFEGNVIGDVAYKTGEYWVYLTAGTKELRIKHPQTQPLQVVFKEYGIEKVSAKVTYTLSVLLPGSENNVKQQFTIRYTPQDAIVIIDSKPYQGSQGVVTASLQTGQHDYLVTASGYEPVDGSIRLKATAPTTLRIDLEKTKDVSGSVTTQQKAAELGNEEPPKKISKLSSPANDVSDNNDKEFALRSAVETFTVKGVSFNMIRVDGGTFTMGATSEQGSDADDDEKPAHQVTLSTYYIGETEVTQALWETVMGDNPSKFKGAQRPVEMVSWEDCQKFIRKLSQLTGKNFRLPTEAEWEYAARGGNKSRGYKYSGSNNLSDITWYDGNNGIKAHVIKTKQPNELGIYDMSGNVWEWCQDYYGTYSSSAQTNPTGPYSGSNRVLRGGCWGKFAKNFRVSYRKNLSSDFRNFNLGLRLVL